MKKFIPFSTPHCHIRSLDSASTLDDFVNRELELETGTITCTDHGYLGACRDVYRAAKENKLTPILGIEAYHRSDDCSILHNHGIEKNEKNSYSDYYKYGHITIHAKDQEAYETLIKVTSDRDLTAERHGSERKPIFTWEDLELLGSKNTTFTSGCLISIVGRHLMAGREDIAKAYYEKTRSLVKPGNFYVEIFPHKCDKNFVNGIFFTLEGGQKIKYRPTKKLRTEEFQEIEAQELLKHIVKGKNVGKFLAVKNYNTWEFVDPKIILQAEHIEDFLPNECSPYSPDGDMQRSFNLWLMDIANKYKDPVICADDSHFSHPEARVIQDVKLGGMGDSFRFSSSYHRQSSEESYLLFKETLGFSEKQFEEILDNNREWASNFKDFSLKNEISLPKSFYPEDTLKHLMNLINDYGRMDWSNQTMKERVSTEIKLLHQNGTVDLLPYFFLSQDGLRIHEEAESLAGPGRGSSAGVMLAYLLGITHVNPLKHDLSLDRFLTLDRIKSGKLPDIDQDLQNRDILLPWLQSRFGDHYVQIGTLNLLHLKSSIKDVARATYGHVSGEMEALCATLPNTPQGVEDYDFVFGYTGEDEKEVKGLLSQHEGLQKYTKKYPELWAKVLKLLGLPRSQSRHASGYIIADKPIDTFIPLMTVKGVRVTQYTAKSCEEAGALKMDYLSLNTLSDIQDTIREIQKRYNLNLTDKSYVLNGVKVPKFRIIKHKDQLYDIWNLPQIPEVFNSICMSDTATVFQVNTTSAQKWLKEFNFWADKNRTNKLIRTMDDLAAFVALDRPGPLDAEVKEGSLVRNMLQEYASRLKGDTPIEPIAYLVDKLPESQGILIYQEQVSKIYQKLTDCDGLKANQFREDIAKKRMAKVLSYYPEFMEKATPKIGPEDAEKIWNNLMVFGGYGFNLSHAISYSYISYACAFLKHFFPLEWWCAVLRNAKKDEIATKFWKHCKNFVKMPDVNLSESNFIIKNDEIRAPLSILKGLGDKAHGELETYRPFKDFDDFVDKIASKRAKKKTKQTIVPLIANEKKEKSSITRGSINVLLASGATDSLFASRLRLANKIEVFEEKLNKITKITKKKIPEQITNMTALQEYLHKKQILPIYSESLPELMYQSKIHGVEKRDRTTDGVAKISYVYDPQHPSVVEYILKSIGRDFIFGKLAFVDGDLLNWLNTEAVIDESRPPYLAVAATVLKYKEFSFVSKKDGKQRRAAKFVLDINGTVFELVKWQNKKNELIVPSGIIDGTAAIAILCKRKNNREFNIEAIIKVEEPVVLKKEKQ